MSPLLLGCYDLILFKLADEEELHNTLDVFQFGQLGRQLPALEHPKIPTLGYCGENGVSLQFFLVVYFLENYSKYFDKLLTLR